MKNKRYRRLTKSRSVTIPKDIAAYLGFGAGAGVDLTATDDGKLIISRHSPTCRFCSGADYVKQYRDIYCCPMCATALYEEVCHDD